MLLQLVALFLSASPGGAGATSAAPAADERRLDLRTVIARARETYPEIGTARAEHDAARASESLARALRRTPRLTGAGTFGVVPGAQGSIEDSPDTPRDLDDFGPFWRLRLDASFPLYAGGALAAGERAARHGVLAREARLRARANRATELAAKAYLGCLLAEQSLEVLQEVRAHVADLVARLQADTSDEHDPLDLFKARGYQFQLDRLEAKARRGRAEALIGLRELSGEPARPSATQLPLLDPAAGDLAAAIEEGLAHNADLVEAREAAAARELLARATVAERGPLVSLDGRFEWGRAPGREPQENPFVYDPWNVRSLGAAVALRWDMSLKQSGARAKRETAEARAARARADGLAIRLHAEIAARHAVLAEAQAVYETTRRALGTTASWLRLAEENHALGSASTKDVVDAYGAYVSARAGCFEALHDLDMAIVSWRLALGREPLRAEENP